MLNPFPLTAATPCPECASVVAPAPDSSWVVAWYTCPRCGHEWSARLRNGRPEIPLADSLLVPGMPREGRA